MFRRHYILLLAFLLVSGGLFAGTPAHDLDAVRATGDRTPGSPEGTGFRRFTTTRSSRPFQVSHVDSEAYEAQELKAKGVPLSVFVVARSTGLDPVTLTQKINDLRTETDETKRRAKSEELITLLGGPAKIRELAIFQDEETKIFNNNLMLQRLTLGQPEGKTTYPKEERLAADQITVSLQSPAAPPKLDRPDSAPPRKRDSADTGSPTGEGGQLGAPSRNRSAIDDTKKEGITQLGPKLIQPEKPVVVTDPEEKKKEDKKDQRKNLAQNQPPEENDRPPGTPGNPSGGGGGSQGAPPGGGGDAKYQPNSNGVTPVAIKSKVELGAQNFAPAISDVALSEEARKALGPREAAPGNYGEEFVKYMEENISSKKQIEIAAMRTQKLINGLVTRIGLDQEVFTQPGTPVVQSIQNAAANTALSLQRKQQIQPNLVNQSVASSALNRTPASVNPRDTFLRNPVRTPAPNSLNRGPEILRGFNKK